MPIEKDFILKGLLQHNYLPFTRPNKEELPPFFTSESFSEQAAFDLTSLPSRKAGYDQLDYKLSLFNGVTRVLSIPHPLPYANLCNHIYINWESLSFITENPNAKIFPEPHDDGRVIIMTGYGGPIHKAHSELNRAFGKRFRVSTDIVNCFPSVYSHAIPWALVGLDFAKQNRDHGEWFNQIDKAARDCKRGETQGIAIGPATSNIITECIFARIDEALRTEFEFVRFIDDYICYCETEDQALNFVRRLEQEAAKYKLHLNARKTEIVRLPQPTVESWLIELVDRQPGENASSTDVFRYLDFAVQLSEKYPNSSVLKYAATAIDNAGHFLFETVNPINYLLSIAFHRVEVLPLLSKQLENAYMRSGGKFYDLTGVNEKLIQILQENIKHQRSDGMAWSLYHLGRFDVPIDLITAESVIATADPLAICSLYWGFKQYQPQVIAYCQSIDTKDVYELDKNWLLLYQVFLDGGITNPYQDKVFEILQKHQVSFMLDKLQLEPDIPDQLEIFSDAISRLS
ncbi:MAG: RNA-directed DNA polymerase [Alkalimonas sp.]|nr:RNA-directed DNA polymerase [Alkalimonas sp.]